MASYIVTYDLNDPGQNYEVVLKVIKQIDGWARLSESSYAITSSLTPRGIYNKFKPHLDKNDQFYVIGLHKPYYGQGDKEVNDWLDNHLQTC
jgi:hypothetical protein